MKTLRGRHKDGYVVIKLFIKPESGINLVKQVEKIKGIDAFTWSIKDRSPCYTLEEYDLLDNVPNAFYFQRVMETDRAAYLVRQYLYSSLYDRIRYVSMLSIWASFKQLMIFYQYSTFFNYDRKEVDCVSNS